MAEQDTRAQAMPPRRQRLMWTVALISLTFLILVFAFVPDQLSVGYHSLLGTFCASAAAFLGYFVVGLFKVEPIFGLPAGTRVKVQAASAAAIFVLFVIYWISEHSRVEVIRRDSSHPVGIDPQAEATYAYFSGIELYRAGRLVDATEALHRAEALGYRPHGSDLDPSELLRKIADELLPEFKWPPPAYSAIAKIPMQVFQQAHCNSLGDVSELLERSLQSAGFPRYGYYRIPTGFVVAAQLERIEDDGSPATDDRRFEFSMRPPAHFTLVEYFQALFRARIGRYRVIVFAVTSLSAPGSSETVDAGTAQKWPTTGASGLPREVAIRQFSSDYKCVALIYEFIRPSSESGEIELVLPSAIAGAVHLSKANIVLGDSP